MVLLKAFVQFVFAEPNIEKKQLLKIVSQKAYLDYSPIYIKFISYDL